MILSTTFEVRDRINIWRHFSEVLAKMKPEQKVVLTLSLWEKKRTLNQNSFFHGPFLDDVCAMYEEVGNDYTKEEIKEQLKQRWGLRKTIKSPDGAESEVLVSTREYTTIQIEDFMMKIRAAFAPFKQLCYPNEDRYEEMYGQSPH